MICWKYNSSHFQHDTIKLTHLKSFLHYFLSLTSQLLNTINDFNSYREKKARKKFFFPKTHYAELFVSEKIKKATCIKFYQNKK